MLSIKNKHDFQELREFVHIARSIIHYDFYKASKQFGHHGGTNNVYKHCVSVGYRAYRIGKVFKLNNNRLQSVVYAALLHDMFGHSFWGNKSNIINSLKNNKGFDKIRKIHAFYHGEEAVINTSKYISLNEYQKDAIIKHMFPLYPIPPKHIEGWILTLADKLVATEEIKDTVIYKLKLLYSHQDVKGKT